MSEPRGFRGDHSYKHSSSSNELSVPPIYYYVVSIYEKRNYKTRLAH